MAVIEEIASHHEAATKIKDQGNAAFKEHRYNKAIHYYTESLKLEQNHLVFGNRAQTYINLQQYELALRDLNVALSINPTYIKNTSRRAKVLSHLGMKSEARLDNETTLKHAPNDKNANMEAAALKGKPNARYTIVKQWNSGEEFEEDEMISIPIAGLPFDQEKEDTVAHPSDPLPPSREEELTVAPAAPDEITVPKEQEEEVPVEKKTTVTGDTVPEAIDSADNESTVSEDTVSEVTVLEQPKDDTVPEEEAKSTVPEDTVVEAPTPETTPLPPTSPTKSSPSLTYVSATAEIRSPSGVSDESWEEVKNESRDSSISDLHPSDVHGRSDDEYTTSPTSPNKTTVQEEEEEGEVKEEIKEETEPTPVDVPEVITAKVEEKKSEKVLVVTVPEVAAQVKKVTVIEKPTVIPAPASNFFDFAIHFNQLKHTPKAFGKYFLSIPPSSHLDIFSNLIQDDHIKTIVAGLTEAANEEVSDLSLISSSLYSVCTLPRFDLLVLFMNDDDRAKAFSLIDLLPTTEETALIRSFFQ